jgi:hypothetical protein
MLEFSGTCSPEQLRKLQSVFDQIWMELRATSKSSYSGPNDPDELRDEIARRVLSCYERESTERAAIVRKVLASFGIGIRDARSQYGAAEHPRIQGTGNGTSSA